MECFWLPYSFILIILLLQYKILCSILNECIKKENIKEKGGNRNMTNKNRKGSDGITLVALVVTIVILLILAGITIMYTMGDNSIFKKAQEAKNKTEEAIKSEQEYMKQVDNMINGYINGTGNEGNQW